MPELPEVQNTVEGLRASVVGKTIADVWTDYHSSSSASVNQFKNPQYFTRARRQLIGQTIREITRRGKYISIILESDQVLLVHMKMTGHFLYGHWEWNSARTRWEPPAGFWDKTWELSREDVMRTMPLSDPYNNFIHLMITFTDDSQLAFSDMRTFARIELLKRAEVDTILDTAIGLDPLARTTTLERFRNALMRRANTQIKTALLDQSLVAGFGNIYTDETLYTARVHPTRPVESITDDEWQLIYQSGKNILRRAIKSGGDSMGDYRRIDGTGGSFQGFHQVYQKEGTPCARCGTIIEKQKIDQRIGRYCPNCQR